MLVTTFEKERPPATIGGWQGLVCISASYCYVGKIARLSVGLFKASQHQPAPTVKSEPDERVTSFSKSLSAKLDAKLRAQDKILHNHCRPLSTTVSLAPNTMRRGMNSPGQTTRSTATFASTAARKPANTNQVKSRLAATKKLEREQAEISEQLRVRNL